jgi:hypothetical protein
MGVGVAWLSWPSAREALAGPMAIRTSASGIGWVIAGLLSIAGLGALIGTWIHTQPSDA